MHCCCVPWSVASNSVAPNQMPRLLAANLKTNVHLWFPRLRRSHANLTLLHRPDLRRTGVRTLLRDLHQRHLSSESLTVVEVRYVRMRTPGRRLDHEARRARKIIVTCSACSHAPEASELSGCHSAPEWTKQI